MEIWDILNADGTPTGRTTPRGGCILKPGEYHLVVHIWVVSGSGRFLIQRRSDDKKLMPGEWAATGGAAIAGEDSFSAARLELFEELGIETDRESLRKLARIKRKNSLLDIWFTVCDTPPECLTLQASEVAEVRLIEKEALSEMIRTGLFHNYGKEYFDLVFEKIQALRKTPVLNGETV